MGEGPLTPRRTVRPRRRGAEAPRVDPEQRDENGLTPWHYLRGKQIICGTCDCHPCADRCTQQRRPDWLWLKAARASFRDEEEPAELWASHGAMTVEQWAAEHPDWIGWELHSQRADVAPVLAQQQARWVALVALGVRRSAFGLPATGTPWAPEEPLGPHAKRRAPNGEERRRIPVDQAMAQAMAVVAGERRPQDVAPPYEEASR